MADWPQPDELKRVLNIEGSNADDWDQTVDRVLAAAIATVKEVRGDWDDDIDAPDERLSAAALRMAELMSERPVAEWTSLTHDPTFRTHMYGQRQRFGVA